MNSDLSSREHLPVLANEVLAYLPEGKLSILDGTFGRGGHAQLMEEKVETYFAMDRDADALKAAASLKEKWQGQSEVKIHDGCFSEMETFVKNEEVPGVDVVLLDLGVSSPQLDQGERGFSFNKPGPLDMRMDSRKGKSAADLIQTMSEKDLADAIFQYGEERGSRKIAKAIVDQRKFSPIRDTLGLANLVESIIPRRGKAHPATKTFQALRIVVNRELEELELALEAIPKILNPGGRAIIISFHSLEDRLVKQAFVSWKKSDLGQIITKKCVTATRDEQRFNTRSRSAKLRCFEKGVAA